MESLQHIANCYDILASPVLCHNMKTQNPGQSPSHENQSSLHLNNVYSLLKPVGHHKP